jgi:hypothetical protein
MAANGDDASILAEQRVNKATATNVDPVHISDGLYSNTILVYRMLSYSSKSIANRDNVRICS